ncbi:hypothetical protein [Polaromonas naphthalenivorans]|uniref:hypothetical protein n=1 Tax=Polaromonas naphthalenivorans TaxID=216465 RepID=UPI00031CB6F0|nr:hypothetical protein [Polaromonas naphthalenivorans]
MQAEQWGIFAVSVLYAVAWMRGLWLHWLAPQHLHQPAFDNTIAHSAARKTSGAEN